VHCTYKEQSQCAKLYDLIAAKSGYSAAGKVTIGLVLHWPCNYKRSVYRSTSSVTLERERWAPCLCPAGTRYTLSLPYLYTLWHL